MSLRGAAALVAGLALVFSSNVAAHARPAPEKSVAVKQVPNSTLVPNSQRGQYSWLGSESNPPGQTLSDLYYRDQVYWGRIEPQDDQFDFSLIESGLDRARQQGGKFNFRIMSYCPGCWMNYRDDFPPVTPAFLPVQAGSTIPAWNDPVFLAQWEELMREIARRYGHDPALGYIDVGGYGAYGEWHVFEGEKITDSNGLRMVRAVTDAFPDQWVLLNSMTSAAFYKRALDANSNLGMRTDNLGCENMYSMVAVSEELQSYWRTRPFHTEWCRQADPVLGASQVKQFHISSLSSGNMPWTHENLTTAQQRAYHSTLVKTGYRYGVSKMRVESTGGKKRVLLTLRNSGTAPTYDAWRGELQLVGKKTSRSLKLKTSLTKVGPGKTIVKTSAVKLKRGMYSVRIRYTDPKGYLAPLALANLRRDEAGFYVLARIRVR